VLRSETGGAGRPIGQRHCIRARVDDNVKLIHLVADRHAVGL